MKKILSSIAFIFSIFISINFNYAKAGGCDINANITASGPTTFCGGDSILLTANFGASYLWTTGDTTQSIWVSQSGAFRVIVTDTAGCVDGSGFTFVNVLPAPDATILSDQLPPFCMGDTVTLFTLNLFSDHEWSTGETGIGIEVSQSGGYSVVVTNFAGCTDTGFYPVAFLPAPFLNVSSDGPLGFCEGQNVEISVSFGFGLDFVWAPNGETTSSITVSDSGTYNVTATNFFGCTATSEDFVVHVAPVPTALAAGDTLLCFPDTIALSAGGGQVYTWSDGSTGSAIEVVPDLGDTEYIVTVSNPGCTVTAKDTVFIHVGGDVIADFSVDPQPLGDETAFTDLSVGSITTWTWDLGNGDTSWVQNPVAIYLEEDTFTVTLIAADQYGCSDTAVKSFGIQQVLTVPNVFTPNGDGFNDSFYIRNKGDGGFNFVVSNRWGQVVFESEGQEVRWNGLTNSGIELQAGTYYYILTIDLKEGEEPVIEKGFITLIKG